MLQVNSIEAVAIMVKVPNPGQLRAARAALQWSLSEARQKLGYSRNAISLYETGQGKATLATMQRITQIYESNGVEFIERGGKPGVLFVEPEPMSRAKKRASAAERTPKAKPLPKSK